MQSEGAYRVGAPEGRWLPNDAQPGPGEGALVQHPHRHARALVLRLSMQALRSSTARPRGEHKCPCPHGAMLIGWSSGCLKL